MRTLASILFIAITFYQNISAQDKTIDSLKKILKTEKEDTNKIYTLNALGKSYRFGEYADFTIVMQYAKEILSLSEKLKFEKGKDFGYTDMALAFNMQQDFSTALKYYFLALRIDEKIQNKVWIAESYEYIGSTFFDENNIPNASLYLSASLKLRQELKDSDGVVQTLNMIGRIEMTKGNFDKALQNFFTALKISEVSEYKKRNWTIMCYHSIANAYAAQAYQLISTKDKIKSEKEFQNALKYYYLTLKGWKELGAKDGVGITYIQIGNVFVSLGKFIEAGDCFQKGITFSIESRQKGYLQYGYLSISILDSIQHNYKQAFEHYKQYILYRDSVFNEQSIQKSLQVQMQYNFDKKQDSTKAAENKKEAIANAEIKNQKTIRNFSYAGSIAILSFAGVGFYRYRKHRKLQSQQEMLNERLRISRELHDDMGSTLGSISIYSEVAKNRSEKNENAEEAIAKIGNASRELIDKMSDIVWSINPNNETFEQLLNRIQVFAAVILTPHEILYTINADEKLKDIKLTAEERKNIYLIYKEAIHNIIKYAACTQVEIKLLLHEEEFIMSIKDNGKGFDLNKLEQSDESVNGNGIKNMRARAESINGNFNIQSSVNSGTKVTFSLEV